MRDKILACTDGSPHGDAAVAWGLDLAPRLGEELTVLHVMDSRVLEGPLMADVSGWVGASPYAAHLPQFREMLHQKGETVLAAARDRAAHAGVEVTTLLKTGHPSTVIREEGKAFGLCVLGRRGEHEEFLAEGAGSTAERVVRQASRACLVAGPSYRRPERMLVAFDGSEHARHALERCLAWAPKLDAQVIVLTVAGRGESETARRVSGEARERAGAAGVPVSAVIADGPEGRAVVEAAGEHRCGLVALGAYGHSLIREWIVGSTVSYLLHHADLPLLVSA